MKKLTISKRFTEFFVKESKRAGIFAMDIAILVLSALFAISIITFVFSMVGEIDRGYSAGTFYYRINDERYSLLSDLADTNRFLGVGIGKSEMEEYYAVADYYRAGFYRRLYEEAGDAERIEYWSRREKTAESGMGVLLPEKKKIDAQLDNETGSE